MPIPRYSLQESVRRGTEWYSKSIRSHEDVLDNFGKVLVIDIETGEYEIDRDNLVAAHRILDRKPEAQLYAMRIGCPALGKMGGGWSAGFERMRREQGDQTK